MLASTPIYLFLPLILIASSRQFHGASRVGKVRIRLAMRLLQVLSGHIKQGRVTAWVGIIV